jgi:hypothetical protein
LYIRSLHPILSFESEFYGQPITPANAGRPSRFHSGASGPAWLRSAFGMSVSGKKFIVLMLALLVIVAVGIPAITGLRRADEASDYSAHAALTAEICDRLATVPLGNPYPASLSELRLTFPDGGDSSLLKRFTYQSAGTNCTLRTRLGREEILRSFP